MELMVIQIVVGVLRTILKGFIKTGRSGNWWKQSRSSKLQHC